MIDKNLISPPCESNGDKIHRITKLVLAGIPVFGGMSIECFDYFFVSPMEKRKEAWMLAVTEAINEIMENGYSENDLKKNENLMDALMLATPIAMKLKQDEKVKWLKNALVHSALTSDKEKEISFFNLIEKFSTWHIKVLSFYSNPYMFIEKNKTTLENGRDLKLYIKIAFPELSEDDDYIDFIWGDLKGNGLINTDNVSRMMLCKLDDTQDLYLGRTTTGFAEELLVFISSFNEREKKVNNKHKEGQIYIA